MNSIVGYYPIKNDIYFFIGFLLMLLDVYDTLNHLEALINDLRYCSEGTHDTDVNTNGRF